MPRARSALTAAFLSVRAWCVMRWAMMLTVLVSVTFKGCYVHPARGRNYPGSRTRHSTFEGGTYTSSQVRESSSILLALSIT